MEDYPHPLYGADRPPCLRKSGGEPLVRISALLERMAMAGLELAQYASYAEIVGGVCHNREQIREWSDKIYEMNRELERLRSNGEVSEVAVADATKTSGVRPPLSLD